MNDLPPLMLAAGHVKTPEGILEFARSDCISEITVGSFTRWPRDGNPEPTFAEVSPGTWINARGLPNGGLQYLTNAIADMIWNAGKKRLRVSIAPIAQNDLIYLTSFLSQFPGAVTLEVNTACLNVWDEGKNKPLICNDPEAFEIALYEVMESRGSLPVAVKVGPMPSENLRSEIIYLCHQHEVDEYVTMNTEGYQTPKGPDGKGIISMPSGGLSGDGIADKAVEEVRLSRHRIDAIHSKMRLVGCGGVRLAAGAKCMKAAGADAVQIGTYAFNHGARVFEDIMLAA